MRNRFKLSLEANSELFGVELSDVAVDTLADYFELIQAHNSILHLVGPCEPEEFATRHILESLTLLVFLPANAMFADVGPGAGLPSIPCLLVRDDLKAVLIESKEKKTKFLEEAVNGLGITERVNIVNRQFEEADPGQVKFVTCRALDKFTDKLPKLLKWSEGKTLLFFGGENLEAGLRKSNLKFQRRLMPLSEKRYLFVIEK